MQAAGRRNFVADGTNNNHASLFHCPCYNHSIITYMSDMVTNKIKELEAAKVKLAQLEQSIADDLAKELTELPAKFGYDSPKAFIKAFKAAASGKPATRKTAKGGKRTRAVITDAIKAKVKELVAADKTGAQIAKIVGISQPSVQNIKKELGLVKARK